MKGKCWLLIVAIVGYLGAVAFRYWEGISARTDYPRIGFASWYSCAVTATGEAMRDDVFSCAMRRSDYGRKYRVCNIETGACVVARHNNWGPSERFFSEGRIVDLSKAAFIKLASLDKGIIPVTVEMVE